MALNPKAEVLPWSTLQQRAEEFINNALSSQLQAAGITSGSVQPIDLRVTTWYNPDLKSRNDIIPGLISMVLGVTCTVCCFGART